MLSYKTAGLTAQISVSVGKLRQLQSSLFLSISLVMNIANCNAVFKDVQLSCPTQALRRILAPVHNVQLLTSFYSSRP